MTGGSGWIGRALIATLAILAFDYAVLMAYERRGRRERQRREKRMRERQTMKPIEKPDARK